MQISDLNAAHKQKFGFPFIIAVRMHTNEGIFFEFNRRLQNDTQTEFANDLQNVYWARVEASPHFAEECAYFATMPDTLSA